MSVIFKGDSIYKSGGGGGGYKDGGELTPAEYITVPNNVIAEYDNSAAEINFIIEDDGKPYNSIIQVSTSVNATVNVYQIRNGFYYLLGVVGTNTINAGDDYTVNIVGNSYVVENVTQPSSDPAAVDIEGQIYGLKKVGSVLWTTSNVSLEIGSYHKYNLDYYYDSFNTLLSGWRLPNKNEVLDLFNTYTPNEVKSKTDWIGSGGNGNNSSGMNFLPKGYWNIYTSSPDLLGISAEFLYLKNGNLYRATIKDTFIFSGYDPAPVRLVHDA